jgi:iron complex transport system substrate-binding protein
MRSLAAWLVAALACIAAPAAPAAPLTLRDDRGEVVTLARPPARIVSLVPSLTESLCALGACARLVGTDRYSNAPGEVAALPKLGGLDDAQIERIVALKPDLLLAAPTARALPRLQALGLPVLALQSRSHADVRRSLQLLAQVVGDPPAADRLWSRIDAQLALAAERVPAAWRGRHVYVEVDAGPFAAGPESFIGETLLRLGLANIVPASLGPFPQLSPEFVVRAQPELIVAESRVLREMGSRPGWDRLRALQRRQGCGFDSARFELIVRPGPRMGEAALLIADCVAALDRDAR